jgi:dipeptidyl aminopeptidase/acylaminoacyl peptidase
MSSNRVLCAVLALAAAAPITHVDAQTAPATPAETKPVPLEEYLRLPAYASPRLSRNGKHFAVTIPVNGKMNLAVIDMETRKGVALTNFSEFDVLGIRWVGNDRLLYTLGQRDSPTGPGAFRGGGLFMVSRDGKEGRKLSPTVQDLYAQRQFVYRPMRFLRSIPGSDDEIIVAANLRDAESYDVYRLNIVSGRTTLLTGNRPTRSLAWLLDRNRVPRVVTAELKDTTTRIVYHRKTENDPFEEIARYDVTKPGAFEPLYFESNNQTLLVASNRDRNTMAIYRYDPATKQLGELVAEDPKFDLDSVDTDPVTDELLGYTVDAEKPRTIFLTEADKRIQRMVDKALPDTYNVFLRVRGDVYIVRSYSDQVPVRWYLLDEGKKTLEELFSSHPWLTKDKLAPVRSFVLKTRDGLEIPSYYVLPASYKPGQKLPTVLHIHGGPHARDDFWGGGFGWQEAQILASRGYAVVLPNFRITPGFGNKIYYSGFGAYGRQMLEDHQDAAKWAVAEGFADPDRICVSGASYGGYATLMSLARFPETFKCGVAGAAPTDMYMMLTSPEGDIPHYEAAVEFWKAILGVKDLSAIPKDISPVNLADKIKQPVMIYHGADDIRVPIAQGNVMIRALERTGNPPKVVVVKSEEGHGFGRVENNVELYTRMIDFLDVSIGPKKAK